MSGFPRAFWLLLILVLSLILITTAPRTQHAQSCASPPSGLVAWWAGDGNANDIQGGNNGTLQNGATFAPGMVGQAFSFDGVSGYVEIPDSPSLNPPIAITLDAWVKPNGLGSHIIVAKYGKSGASWALLDTGAGRLRFNVDSGPNSRTLDTNSPVLTVGVWQHVAATFDTATQALKIYVNGVEAPGTLVETGTVTTIANNPTPVRIGAYRDSGDNLGAFWSGLIDEVGIYNRALTATEIQAIYNAGSAGKCKPQPEPPTTASFFTDPAPSAASLSTEVVLRKELSGYPNYGAADGRADILYTGQVATWHFTLPPSIDPQSLRHAFFRVSLVADDHETDLSQYTIAVRTNSIDSFSGPAGVPHGAPVGTRFTNWVQKDYESTVTPSSYTFTLFNTSTTGSGDWLAVDSIELHLLTNTTFQDDFNRPDGAVGNGWSSWWNDQFNSTNTSITNGKLVTHGSGGNAGGIFRSLPVTFPLQFSFDFKTQNQVAECGGPSNDGGWGIAFNAASAASPPPFNAAKQLWLYQFSGSRPIGRTYRTPGGDVSDSVTALTGATTQRDYMAASAAHIEGTVNADLSAVITVRYNDGQTPDPVTFSFGPATNPVTTPPGAVFILSNVNCSSGPHIFDNLVIGPPTALSSLSLNPVTVAAGQPSTGTVTLSAPALEGGAIVALASSNNAAATVPESITIPQGLTSGAFTVTTKAVTSDTPVTITASYLGATTTATLMVTAPRADLQVSSLSAPSQAVTDSAFEVSWVDANNGQGRAGGPWTDKVYLSADDQPGGDTLLAQFPFDGSLDGGQGTPPRIQQVSIPRAAVPAEGQYFLIVTADADNNVDEGSNEGNNWRAVPVTVSRPALPDLVVDSIQAPTTAFFDQTVTVRWTVRNAGNGSTNASEWRDRLSLSPNQAGGDEAVQLDVSNISYLNAGESYVASADVHIPRGLFGTYFFIVRADSGNAVTEDNENNNTRSQAISLQVPPLPDLQVTLVQAPESGFAGQPMQLNWRVENHGTGNTPSAESTWLDGIYLSKTQTLDSSARLIGSRQHDGGLAHDDGYTVSNFTVNVPVDVAGDRYVFVVADYQNKVYEFVNENNNSNLDARHAIHIQATPPDLIVPAIEAQSAAAAAGSQVTVNWTVRNQGAFDAGPGWFDTVYLSTDATLDPANDTPLATVFHPSSLGPGLEYSASTTVGLPACISGTYFLFVFTDSRNQIFEFDPGFDAERNNFSQAHPIQITLALPDLQVTSVSNPPTGNAGETVPVAWTVTNGGSGATAEGSWEDHVYLSQSPTLDTNAALLAGNFTHSGQLAVNGSYTNTQSVNIPSGAQGVYHVFVLTDARGQVEECAGEGNNAGASQDTINVINNQPPPPDLTVTNVSAPVSTFTGQTVTVQWTVNNAGTAVAPNSAWNDIVYLSADGTLGIGDTRVATKLVKGPLATGASYSAQAQAVIPVVPAGTYFLIVRADGDDFIPEGQREDNNTGSAVITLSAPSVDLQVTSVDAPAQALSGQNMVVSWSVRNAGAMQTSAQQWTDYVFLSRDQVLDPTDPVIGFQTHTSPLDSGGEYTASVNAAVPPGLSGPYYVFVRTDYHNQVPETVEDNNVGGPAAVSLQLPPPVDLTVASVEPPADASPGEQATFRWVVRNAGANTATGSWTDAVYLSTDSNWDINDTLVGRVGHDGPVAPGETYTGDLTAALPAVNPGQYHVIVRTDVRNNVRESDETNNTTASTGATTVDVPELQLGVPFSTTLQTGQERYHKVNAPAGETLLYTLHAEQQDSSTELYARAGAMPSRSAFDYLFSRPGEADQEIVVPNTLAGFYYSLTRGEFVSGTTPATVKAETIPFSIRSVSPDRIGDNGQVTITLHGARFQDGATVQLVGNGTTLTAAKVMVLDSATAKARFFFTNAPHGAYDVVLTNPGGALVNAQQAETIEKATPLLLDINTIGNLGPRIGRTFSTQSVLRNLGNVDVPYAFVTYVFNGQVTIGVRRPADSLPRQTDYPNANWAINSPTSRHTDSRTYDSFIVRDLEAGAEVPFEVSIRGYVVQRYTVQIAGSAIDTKDFYQLMQDGARTLRERLLSSNLQLPTALTAALSTEDSWWQYTNGTLAAAGFLDAPPTVMTAKSSRESVRADAPLSTAQQCETICGASNIACEGSEVEETLACGEDLILAGQPEFVPGCLLIYYLNRPFCHAVEGVCLTFCTETLDTCDRIRTQNTGPSAFQLFCIQPTNPRDPNDKEGLVGFGPQAFAGFQQQWPYTINFENVSTATAAAQRIRITDQLDPNLDARTFRLKEIGFGSYRVTIPENRAFYQTRVQLSADHGNLLADVSAGVDIATGQVTWTLTAIDPQTGEQPTSAALGLLPPNDDTGRGQGYVTYTVQPKATAPTGTQIANSATITFDAEEPITTNAVTNTLDAGPPTSAVTPLPAASDQTFTLSWSGEDPADGSGLQSFDIWVSENGGPYQPFLSGTTATSAQFNGNPGSTYRFYSVARDNAGNVEAAPSVPDAVTTVTPQPNPVPTLTTLNPNSAAAGEAQFTLTAAGANFVNGSVLNWNGSPRVTTFVTSSQVTAAIPASDIASDGTATVTVTNPAPGGGSSNPLTFNITAAATPTPTPTPTPSPTPTATPTPTPVPTPSPTQTPTPSPSPTPTPTATPTPTPSPSPTPTSVCVGDLNLDGVVNTADMEIVRSAFGSRCGTPEYRAAADVNHDCVVDVTDLAIVSRDLGCTWTPPRFSIGGRVADGAGAAIGNVTLTLSGSQSATAQTDGGGAYSFTNLSAGNYIVTPTLTGFTFNPASLSFASLVGDQTASFTGVPNTFVLAGKVTFGNVGLGGVTIAVGGSQTRTVTTDSGGNFLISNLPQLGTYTITPSRTNFTFSPQNQTLDNPGGNQAANFTAAVTPGVPVLISEENSTRAVALDSVLWLPGPFALNYSTLWGVDKRTRVTLFATNFDFLPGDTVSSVTADAEDASHHIYPLTVEYVGNVDGFDWLRRVTIRLNDDMGDVGDVLVRINVRGLPSNRVRLGVGHIGGGPPDDTWAVPTPGRQP
jgi:subtilase family serine protease